MAAGKAEERGVTLGTSFPASPWCTALVHQHVWVGEDDGTIGIRALETGREQHYIPRKTNCVVTQLLLANPEEVWAALSDGCIRVYNVESRKLVRQFSQHVGAIHAMEMFGDYVFTAGADSLIHQWDPMTCQLVHTYDGHGGEVRCLALARGLTAEREPGSWLLSGSSDHTIRVWYVGPLEEPEEEMCAHVLSGHTGTVRCLAVHGRHSVWSGAEDGSIRVWDLATFQLLDTLERHGCPVLSLVPTPDGCVWSAGKGGEVLQWDGWTHQLRQVMATLPARLNGLKPVAVIQTYHFWACLANGTVVPFTADLAVPASDPQQLNSTVQSTALGESQLSETEASDASALDDSRQSLRTPPRPTAAPRREAGSPPRDQRSVAFHDGVTRAEVEALRAELERERLRANQAQTMGDLARAEASRLTEQFAQMKVEIITLRVERDDWQAQAMRSPAAATSTAAAPGDPNDNPVNRLFVVQQEAMSLRRHVKELQAAHEAEAAKGRAAVADLQGQLAREMDFVRAAERRAEEAERAVRAAREEAEAARRDTELKHAGLRQQTAKWNTKCAELEALLVARGNDLQAMQRRLTEVEGDLEDCQAGRSALGKAQDAMREAVASSIGHIRQLFPQLEMEELEGGGNAVEELSELVTVLCEDRLQVEEVAVDLAHALVGRCHIDPDEGLVANLQTIADVVSFLAHSSPLPSQAKRDLGLEPSSPTQTPVAPLSANARRTSPLRVASRAAQKAPPPPPPPPRSRSRSPGRPASPKRRPSGKPPGPAPIEGETIGPPQPRPRSPSPTKTRAAPAAASRARTSNPEAGLIKGVVGQWLGTQQYGYIVPDAGQGVKRQIFVDASVLPPYLSAPAPGQPVLCSLVPYKPEDAPIAHTVVTCERMGDGALQAVVYRWHEKTRTGLLRPAAGQWLREAEAIAVDAGVVPAGAALREGDGVHCVVRPPRLAGGTQWCAVQVDVPSLGSNARASRGSSPPKRPLLQPTQRGNVFHTVAANPNADPPPGRMIPSSSTRDPPGQRFFHAGARSSF